MTIACLIFIPNRAHCSQLSTGRSFPPPPAPPDTHKRGAAYSAERSAPARPSVHLAHHLALYGRDPIRRQPRVSEHICLRDSDEVHVRPARRARNLRLAHLRLHIRVERDGAAAAVLGVCYRTRSR